LIASLSIKYKSNLKWIQIDGNRIYFSPQLPKKYKQEKIYSYLKANNIHNNPLNYTVVRIFVKGRTETEATEGALNSLDLLRGIWNFSINRTKKGRASMGKLKPINNIRKGPFQTLHKKNGDLATMTIWYDTNYVQEMCFPPSFDRNRGNLRYTIREGGSLPVCST
jgi:hypothetical protein